MAIRMGMLLAPLLAVESMSGQSSTNPDLNQLLTGIVLEHLPHNYVDEKKWGQQEKRWSGIEFRRDGDRGRLESQRRYRMVNHGTWQKYRVELIDPQQQFSVGLHDVARTENGLTSFSVSFDARLKLEARQSKWAHGVQLYSLTADGHATVRLQVFCELDTGLDFRNFPPDLVFMPTVTDARIVVDDFRLDRVSKVGGELAQQVSRYARRELEQKIEQKEQQLVRKINERIAKKQDRLRLSVVDAVKLNWYSQTREFLPENVKQALNNADDRR